MVIGITIAMVLTLFRLSNIRVLSAIATTWVEIARNTPALFQIYMVHFGLGGFGIHLSPFLSLLIGIAFNNAGYLTENFRGALKAIPDTQTRAARSLGMTPLQAFQNVIMPQMLRISFLPMTNQMVWAILMTSLGAVVGHEQRSLRRHQRSERAHLPHLRTLRDRRGDLLPDHQGDHPVGPASCGPPVPVLKGRAMFNTAISRQRPRSSLPRAPG